MQGALAILHTPPPLEVVMRISCGGVAVAVFVAVCCVCMCAYACVGGVLWRCVVAVLVFVAVCMCARGWLVGRGWS